jgi:hypothetical protein
MRDWLCFPPLLLSLNLPAAAECVPFTDAHKHVGESRCVSGKVVAVQRSQTGIHYLDFCQDYRACPFTVVVFASDLKHVGDVRQLQGREIEIHGPVKEYKGRAEIILRELRQLRGEAAQIPPLPRNYDVERKGRYRAGKFGYAKSPRKPARRRQTAPVQIEEATEPAGSPE